MSSLVKLEVQTPKLPELGSRASEVIEVDDADSYQFAVNIAAEMKGRWKEIDTKRVELKAGALKACKDIDAFFKPALDFYASEELAIKTKLTVYINVQRRLEAKRQEELNKAAKAEQDALAKKAAAAIKKGDIDGAQALLEQAAVTAPENAPRAALKVEGGHTRKDWTVELVDLAAFLRFAVENPAYLQHVDVNIGSLKRLISAGGTIPAGVKAEQIEIPVLSTF